MFSHAKTDTQSTILVFYTYNKIYVFYIKNIFTWKVFHKDSEEATTDLSSSYSKWQKSSIFIYVAEKEVSKRLQLLTPNISMFNLFDTVIIFYVVQFIWLICRYTNLEQWNNHPIYNNHCIWRKCRAICLQQPSASSADANAVKTDRVWPSLDIRCIILSFIHIINVVVRRTIFYCFCSYSVQFACVYAASRRGCWKTRQSAELSWRHLTDQGFYSFAFVKRNRDAVAHLPLGTRNKNTKSKFKIISISSELSSWWSLSNKWHLFRANRVAKGQLQLSAT